MNPAGSFGPGWMNFAITPATKPMMMVQRMFMVALRSVSPGNGVVPRKFRMVLPVRIELTTSSLPNPNSRCTPGSL